MGSDPNSLKSWEDFGVGTYKAQLLSIDTKLHFMFKPPKFSIKEREI